MKKYFAIIFLLCCFAKAQDATISPTNPKVLSGSAQQFTCTNCPSPTYSIVRGVGTISPSGLYTPPSTVDPKNQSRGCQVLARNSIYNVPVTGSPVDSHSTTWLNRAAQYHPEISVYHQLVFFGLIYQGFYDNTVDNSTNQQLMHFFNSVASTNYQDTNFPMPLPPNVQMQSGWSQIASGGPDRHEFTINKDTCETTEIYNLYQDFKTVSLTAGNPTQITWTTNSTFPPPNKSNVYITGGTGSWTPINSVWQLTVTGTTSGTISLNSTGFGAAPGTIKVAGTASNCNTCQSAGGQKFQTTNNAIYNGVDAGGSPIGATSFKAEEIYLAAQAGKSDLGHSVRTTFSNVFFSARHIWPATNNASSVSGSLIPIIGISNGSPAIITTNIALNTQTPCNNYTYTVGCAIKINITGATSSWVPVNGDQTCTAIDNFHCSIPINTTTFGSFSGQHPNLVFDFFPYGACIVLDPAFNVDTFCSSADLTTSCPYIKVMLRTLQKYCIFPMDGTSPADDWNTGIVSSEFHPAVLMQAYSDIRNSALLAPIESHLKVLDISGLKQSSDPASLGLTNTDRITVRVASAGHNFADTDIYLQGTAIGTDEERLTIPANTTHQLNVWVTGNASTGKNFSIDAGITGATVSGTGLVSMPNCSVAQNGMVTATANSDSTAKVFIEVTCLPVNTDGSYRLLLGYYQAGAYTDFSGFKWWGSTTARGFGNVREVPGLYFANQYGTWEGQSICRNDAWTGVDSQLFSRSTSFQGDTTVKLAVPNGTYNVTLNAEPGYDGFVPSNNTCPTSAGRNIYDFEVNGNVASEQSYIDGWIAAGNQNWHGYSLNKTVTVTNGILSTIARVRIPSTYGASVSSLLITPTTPCQFAITTLFFPGGMLNAPYSQNAFASCGTSPYTWTLYNGTLPTGLSLTQSGDVALLSGTPTDVGTFNFTLQAQDSAAHSDTQAYQIQIGTGNLSCCSPPIIPFGQETIAYYVVLTASGGLPPYSYGIISGAIPGVGIDGATGVYSGIPTMAGTYQPKVRVVDAMGHIADKTYPPTVITPATVSGSNNMKLSGSMKLTGGLVVK